MQGLSSHLAYSSGYSPHRKLNQEKFSMSQVLMTTQLTGDIYITFVLQSVSTLNCLWQQFKSTESPNSILSWVLQWLFFNHSWNSCIMELRGPCYRNDRELISAKNFTFSTSYPPPHRCYLNNSIKILGDSALLISSLINCTMHKQAEWGWVRNPSPTVCRKPATEARSEAGWVCWASCQAAGISCHRHASRDSGPRTPCPTSRSLSGYIIPKASGAKLEINTWGWCRHVLPYRIAPIAVKGKKKIKIKKISLFKLELWSLPVYYLVLTPKADELSHCSI